MAACQSWITLPCCKVVCLWCIMCFLLRCFSCSHTVLPKEHSLGVIFFLLSLLLFAVFFFKNPCISLLIVLCMIVYVTNKPTLTLTLKQSWFKHLWELHKEWTEAGVSASRVTTLRRRQEKGYQATSEPETTSEASYLGCGEKELDCCSVVQSPLFRWK